MYLVTEKGTTHNNILLSKLEIDAKMICSVALSHRLPQMVVEHQSRQRLNETGMLNYGNTIPMRTYAEALKQPQPSHPTFPNHTASAVPPEKIESLSINLEACKSKQPQLHPVSQYNTKKEVIIRNYHEELAQSGKEGKNYIMVTPTGLDKTIAAALVIADHLTKYKSRHVVFVTETKFQASKQKEALTDLIPNVKVAVYTGEDNATEINDSIKHQDDISVWTAGKLHFEIAIGHFTLADLSLIVFDECHHAVKRHDYSKLMEQYLERRSTLMARLPQIIGLTASPGAGDNPTLDVKMTFYHLLQLAARMDATGGYKSISENQEEFDQCSRNSEFSCTIPNPRNISADRFYSEVVCEMERLEKWLPPGHDFGLSGLTKLSEQYRATLRTRMHDLEHTADRRDDISTLKLLECYSGALDLYMDLQQKDAVKAMKEQTALPEDDTKCTLRERIMKDRLTALLDKIDKYPTENPRLVGVGKFLYSTFKKNPQSQGIIFVSTKRHAHGLYDWVLNNPHLKSIIRPDVIIGAARKSIRGMSQHLQNQVMTTFRKGQTNLLISTSVAEKMDIPECNLIIRYQHVSNEISKIQTQGQAKFENSHCYFIASDSKKEYKEFKNQELNRQVDIILKDYFPTGMDLETRLKLIQNDIIKEKMLRKIQLQKCEEVKLLCRKCQTFVCNGSDVYVKGRSELAYHYVVPIDSFTTKYVSKKLPKPQCLRCDSNRIKKIEKIHCSNCEQDWGSRCEWIENGCILPVLKCKQFVFEANGSLKTYSKWSNAPFRVKPFTAWLTKK